jgi:NAD(P)H-dependent FMN reductase
MTKLLVVTSSVREGRSADNILALTQVELKNNKGFEVRIFDFKQTPLPFFNAPAIPSSEDFAIEDENVKKWSNSVSEADAVLILAAEYNHSYTPVLKNAIDWLFKEWGEKPVGLIGYGWSGGSKSIAHLRGVLASLINAKATESEANLRFMKEINLDGTVADQAETSAQINKVLNELKTAVLEK